MLQNSLIIWSGILMMRMASPQDPNLDPSQVNDLDYLLALPPHLLQMIPSSPSLIESLTSETLSSLLTLTFLNIQWTQSQTDILRQRYIQFTLNSSNEEATTMTTTTTESPMTTIFMLPTNLSESVLREISIAKKESLARGPPLLNLFLDDLNGTQLAERLNSFTDDQIRVYISNLGTEMLRELGSKPGTLLALNEDRLLLLAQRVDVLTVLPIETILSLAEKRSEILSRLSISALNTIVSRPGFITRISSKTLMQMIRDPELGRQINRLSKASLGNIISLRPEILLHVAKLRKSATLKRRMFRLLSDEAFLAQIPISAHAYLAESTFRNQLTIDSVLMILKVHPSLPSRLSTEAIQFYTETFLRSGDPSKFINRLTCSTILNGASDISLVNRLDPRVLRLLIRSQRTWECLPVELVVAILRKSRIGNKIGITDALAGIQVAFNLRSFQHREKGNLAWSALRYQVPQYIYQLYEK